MKMNLRLHEIIYQAIERHPGLTASQVEKAAHLSRNAVRSMLPGMEKTGHLVFEDGQGRLWVFSREESDGSQTGPASSTVG